MSPGRLVALVFFALLGACTVRSALDTLTSPEDRAFAQAMVQKLRVGDEAWLRQRFAPELWVQSRKQIGEAPRLYPAMPGSTDLLSFSVSTNTKNGVISRSKEFRLVTHGGGRWTVTSFATFSNNGPDRVIRWSVTPHSTPPPELVLLQSWDRAVPWVWGTVVLILVAASILVVWLVRRSRRRADPLSGQRGTP